MTEFCSTDYRALRNSKPMDGVPEDMDLEDVDLRRPQAHGSLSRQLRSKCSMHPLASTPLTSRSRESIS